MDWEHCKIQAREENWFKAGVQVSIYIRTAGQNTVNYNKGCHILAHMTQLIDSNVD